MFRTLRWATALSLLVWVGARSFGDEPKKAGPLPSAAKTPAERPPEPPPPPPAPREDDGAFPASPPPPRPDELDDDDDGPRPPRPPRRAEGDDDDRPPPPRGERGRPDDEPPRKHARSLPRKAERGEPKERREAPDRREGPDRGERSARKAARPGEPRMPDQPSPPRPPMERSPFRGRLGGEMGMGGPMGMGGMLFGGPPGAGGHDPEMMKLAEADRKLEVDSRTIAEEIRRARHGRPSAGEGPNVDALKKKLVDTVEEHFRVRQQKRKLELERLEQQLVKLRDSVRSRDDKKSSLIERRIAELIGAEDTGF